MTASIRALLSGLSSTSGNRTRGNIMFNRLSAYLTGAGLLSHDSAAVNVTAVVASHWASTSWPCRNARCMARHRRGATFDVTEMQPSPPWSRKASAVASSPDSNRNSGPSNDRKRSGRVTSPVASLRPMICGSSRQPRNRVVCQAADGAGRDVVKDERQAGSIARRHENVRTFPPASVCCSRARRTRRRRRRLLAHPCSIRSPGWSIGAGARDDRYPTVRGVDRNADDGVVLRPVQIGRLAGRAAHDQGAGACLDLTIAKALERGDVDLTAALNSVGRAGA